jgi:hypothetical protein
MIFLSVVFRNALLTQDLTPPDDFVRRGFFVGLPFVRYGASSNWSWRRMADPAAPVRKDSGCLPRREIVGSVSRGFKRLAQPLHFKAGAKQREQTSRENHAPFGDEENVGAAIKLGEVPEDRDAE